MKTSELIQLQVLKRKSEILDHHPDLESPAWMTETYEREGNNRNVCAMLPLPLFEEIERLSIFLNINKRRIIEMALRDFAVQSNEAFKAAGFDTRSMTCELHGEAHPEDVEPC